jgi:hypothetical protein
MDDKTRVRLIEKAVENFEQKTMAAFSQEGRFIANGAVREVVSWLLEEYERVQESASGPIAEAADQSDLVGCDIPGAWVRILEQPSD